MAADPRPCILVLADQTPSWFSSPGAIAELLYLEGINDVEVQGLDRISPSLLEQRSLVILGPCDLGPAHAAMLLEHVAGGGGLISLLPGEALTRTLGLGSPLKGILNGRIRIESAGYPEVSLPIKGWSQFYDLSGAGQAEQIAPLLAEDDQETGYPAVLQLSHGKGKIVVFAYDLAASVYLLRQGNPAMAAGRSTGFARMRPSDLFYQWQDSRTAELPVADLQCHFFRELVHRAWPEETVLPWVWYFPNGAGTVLLFTSDDDWSTVAEFDQLLTALEKNNASATFYLVQVDSTMERCSLEALVAKGFDFSIHPDLPPPTGADWEHRLSAHIAQFEERYQRRPSSSVRNHCIAWAGYLKGVKIQSRLGFDVDANYFTLAENGRCYMTGSGLMMPFVDLDGEVLPIFQLPTQFSEEAVLAHPDFTWSLNLTPDEGVRYISRLMLENRDRNQSMLCINSHPVSFANYSASLWEPILEFAKAEGIPVLNVDQYQAFWKARREIRLKPVRRGDVDGYQSANEGQFKIMFPDNRQ